MKKEIKWGKWINPMGDEEIITKQDYFNKENEDEDEEKEENSKNMLPVMLTQFGPLPIKPYNVPSKYFRFWIAHTNFPITQKVKKIIMDIPGVEIFDVFSPYRFRIAIGMCFDEKEVMDCIDYSLVHSDNIFVPLVNIDKELADKIENIKKEIQDSKHLYWSLFILPNKSIEYFHTENLKEFQKKKEEFMENKELVGGVLLCSDGQNS